AITLGSASLTIISTQVTQSYGTAAYTTVPGDWTFYQYVTATDHTRTLVTETSGFAVSTASVQITVLTETVPFTETSNICPTRTLNFGTTTIYVRSTDGTTEYITTGTTFIYSTIASTIVFDPE